MKMATFRDWHEYKDNKLASKQADKMFDTLCAMRKRKASVDEFQAYYKELSKTHLYIKHGALYCQVLSDVHYATRG